jgi:hypothetical protein
VAAQLESDAQRFVDDVGKGMRGIDGDGSQNRIDPAREKEVHRIFARAVKVRHRQDANALAGKCWQQFLIPALILIGNEGVDFLGQTLKLLGRRESVRTCQWIPVFHLLEQPRYPHFNKFIEIAGRDREEFDSFEQRIAFVLCLFQNTPVESQPGFVAIKIISGIIQADAGHR